MYVVTNRTKSAGEFGAREASEHSISHVEVTGESFRGINSRSFRRQVLEDLKGQQSPECPNPRAIMGVHGFNVSWGESLEYFRTLESLFAGPDSGAITVGWSWPSSGRATGYIGDRAKARSTAISMSGSVTSALRLLQDEKCPANLVAVAHSMGTYVLAKAAQYAVESAGLSGYHIFSEVLLVASDMDGGAFSPGGFARDLASLSRRVTIYRSSHDGAVALSRAKRANTTGRRLGRQGPDDLASLPDNVVVVDASSHTNVNPIDAHGEHFQNEWVTADMAFVINGVDRRSIPNRAITPEGEFTIEAAP